MQPDSSRLVELSMFLEGEETAGTSAVDLTLLPESCRPVKLLPDGQGLMYQSRVEGPEEGTQSQLG